MKLHPPHVKVKCHRCIVYHFNFQHTKQMNQIFQPTMKLRTRNIYIIDTVGWLTGYRMDMKVVQRFFGRVKS